MNVIAIQYYKTPFGELILGSFEDKLCLCDWRYRKMRTAIDSRIQKVLNAEYKEENTTIINQTIIELEEYFQGNRTVFTIPIQLAGTDFQCEVWNALQQIPYGKTMSYKELSQLMRNEKAIRAVASANGANALSILIPCHRIIGSNGDLVGYAGGLSAKKKLLELEGISIFTQLKLF